MEQQKQIEQQQNQQNQIEQILSTAITKIRAVADVDTIVGKPVVIDQYTTVIPVSKMTLGFLAGGGEYGGDNNKKNQLAPSFAGGSGGTVTISPVGFLIAKEGSLKLANMDTPEAGENKWLSLVGEVIAKISKKTNEVKK